MTIPSSDQSVPVAVNRLPSSTRTTESAERSAESVTHFPELARRVRGPDEYLEHLHKSKQAIKIPVIASGGINSLKDIKELAAFEADGVSGAIAGRALYEGRFSVAEARASLAG